MDGRENNFSAETKATSLWDIPCTFHLTHSSFLGIKLNSTLKACMSFFLLLWFWSSFCLYPILVWLVMGPLRKLCQMVIEQKKRNVLNILNMQLAREMREKSCFSSLTQKQGAKNVITKTERLKAVLSEDGKTERKHHSGLQTEERLLQWQKESLIPWPLCKEKT